MSIELTADDLALTETPSFPAKEVVEFICQDIDENETYQSLNLKCKVQAGKHAGRTIHIRLSKKRDHEMQRVKLARWALAFYSQDEILSNTIPLARMVGRRFTAVAQAAREHNGKTYQDFDFFRDMGDAGAPDAQPPSEIASDVPF